MLLARGMKASKLGALETHLCMTPWLWQWASPVHSWYMKLCKHTSYIRFIPPTFHLFKPMQTTSTISFTAASNFWILIPKNCSSGQGHCPSLEREWTNLHYFGLKRRASRATSVHVNILLQIGIHVLEHQIQHWLIILLNMLHAQQPSHPMQK